MHPARHLLLTTLFALTALLCATPAWASSDIDILLKTPEERIDLGKAALIFAKEIYPEIDVADYNRKIEEMVGQARRRILMANARDPEQVIRVLNTYFYKEWGVRYDTAPDRYTSHRNFFINNVLDQRVGVCYTIPLLYMVVAQRLGYPVYPVLAPEHQFVRFVDPAFERQNIELSAGAGYSTDAEYAYKLNVSDKAIRNGAYLRTLTKRQYLGTMLQQNALVFARARQYDRAIGYFEKAQRLDSKNVYFSQNLGSMWLLKGKHTLDSAEARKYRAISKKYFNQAEEMGWTQDPDANTRKNP